MSVWNVAGIIVLSHLFVGELFRDGGTPNLATSRDPQTQRPCYHWLPCTPIRRVDLNAITTRPDRSGST